MKIAFISLMNDAPWGGSEILWSKTASEALADGHEVLITAYRHDSLPQQLVELVKGGATLFYRTAYRPELYLRLYRRLKHLIQPGSDELRKLKEFAPDLVFVNQGGYNDVIHKPDICEWLVSGHVPYVLICHLYKDPLKVDTAVRIATLAVYKQARYVFTISHTQTKVLERQLAASLTNSLVVQNPLNLPAHMPVEFPAIEIPQLAVVASLDTDRKGHDVLFQVLSAPHWQEREWCLNIYGKGPDKVYLEQLLKHYSLENKIVFHGHVADSSDIWRNNHVLVIPSRIESGPMVLVEAMLSGRPVVSTNVGLVKDWLDDGQTGFIAEASLPDSLHEALERCWLQQADWEKMGTLAFERAAGKVQPDPARTMLNLLVQAAAV